MPPRKSHIHNRTYVPKKSKGKKAKSFAAKKGWETRRKNAAKAKRVAAAQKGWETRRHNKRVAARKAGAEKRKRSTAARKGLATKHIKASGVDVLGKRKTAKAGHVYTDYKIYEIDPTDIANIIYRNQLDKPDVRGLMFGMVFGLSENDERVTRTTQIFWADPENAEKLSDLMEQFCDAYKFSFEYAIISVGYPTGK